MRRFTILLCVVIAGLVGFVGTAAAHPSNSGVSSASLVDGFDALTDDWGDHFSDIGNSLCNGCADSFNTDTVMMWQAILVAEGFLPISEIDGQFGPITASATQQWQTRFQIGVDGQVGNQTWTTADNRLSSFQAGSTTWVIYDARGGNGEVGFFRGNESAGGLDGGAFELVDVFPPTGQGATFNGIRIQHFSKTISGPARVARSGETQRPVAGGPQR